MSSFWEVNTISPWLSRSRTWNQQKMCAWLRRIHFWYVREVSTILESNLQFLESKNSKNYNDSRKSENWDPKNEFYFSKKIPLDSTCESTVITKISRSNSIGLLWTNFLNMLNSIFGSFRKKCGLQHSFCWIFVKQLPGMFWTWKLAHKGSELCRIHF